MKVITAVENYNKQENDIFCFLAGGITNCQEWQDRVIELLSDVDNNLVVFNPRRKNFPINDPNASLEQIQWEFDKLEQCDIFSMYFDGPTKSDQPICFYELGRNIERMKQKFRYSWMNRLVISCNSNFKRFNDVLIQTKLAIAETNTLFHINESDNFKELCLIHANSIKEKYERIKYINSKNVYF